LELASKTNTHRHKHNTQSKSEWIFTQTPVYWRLEILDFVSTILDFVSTMHISKGLPGGGHILVIVWKGFRNGQHTHNGSAMIDREMGTERDGE
jgi:hypothetical protein